MDFFLETVDKFFVDICREMPDLPRKTLCRQEPVHNIHNIHIFVLYWTWIYFRHFCYFLSETLVLYLRHGLGDRYTEFAEEINNPMPGYWKGIWYYGTFNDL